MMAREPARGGITQTCYFCKKMAVLLPPAMTAALATAVGVGWSLNAAPFEIGMLSHMLCWVLLGSFFVAFGLVGLNLLIRTLETFLLPTVAYFASSGLSFGICGGIVSCVAPRADLFL